jgi:plasmid replication initiation protein
MNNIKRGGTIAVRSDSIIEARFSLTAKQNELLDMLLCEIENDEQYQYLISVDKYKQYYDTDTSNLYRDLKKAAKDFEGKGFRIVNKATSEEIYYSWFSKIHYKPKKAEIQVNVDLDFKKLLWEVKKKIYYDIKNTLNFSSAYSQRLYYYLKSFEDTGWRIDSIEKLQTKLECPPSYKNFADFKRAVLEVAYNEINATSDICFEYETQKTGRKVTGLKFSIKKKGEEDSILKEVVIDKDEKNTDKNTQFINEVRSFIEEPLDNDSILDLLETANFNIGVIKEKYELMKRQNDVVDNIVSWLKKAIKTNYKPKVKMISTAKKTKGVQTDLFNNFEQRTSDNFDEIEKGLLSKNDNIGYDVLKGTPLAYLIPDNA